MCLTKEEHDAYINMMIKNLAYDEAAYNIDHKLSFREPSDVVGVIFEELEETEEALKQLNASIRDFFENIRYNSDQEVILARLATISLNAEFVVGEAVQVKAVAIKALKQLQPKEVVKDA